jgi:hypothetical protein
MGAIVIALVLGAWSWFGIWVGVIDISSGLSVAALVAGNVVTGWFIHDMFFGKEKG